MTQRNALREGLESYLSEVSRALLAIDLDSVDALLSELMRAWREGRQVLSTGNGGSAAMASHMANDLNKAVSVPGLPRMRAISLCDNVPLLTAWANDSDYAEVFAEPLRNLCQRGDLVVALSCSGNSSNVVRGLEVARELGARTALLTGSGRGCACALADVSVCAPAGTVAQQEDVHLALNHVISRTLHDWLKRIADYRLTPPRALVLAAGEGTRLRPITLDRPKPMVPIGDRPLLEHTLQWLRRHEIDEVAINLHYRPEVITRHFGDGKSLGVSLTYSHEDRILGTAGALRNLNGFLNGGPLVVVYGDVLTDLDLTALLAYHYQVKARRPDTALTMGLYRVDNPTEVGLVGLEWDGEVSRFVEKPDASEVFTDLAAAGVMVVEPTAVESIPAGRFFDFGKDLFPLLLSQGKPIYGWIMPPESYLIDIGSPERYARAQREWPGRAQALAR